MKRCVFTCYILLVVAYSSQDTYEKIPAVLALLSGGCTLTFTVLFLLQKFCEIKNLVADKRRLFMVLASFVIGLALFGISFGVFAALNINLTVFLAFLIGFAGPGLFLVIEFEFHQLRSSGRIPENFAYKPYLRI